MRFLIHGAVHPDVQSVLAKHQHACHGMLELSGETDALGEAADDPTVLLPLLEKKQWNLVTTESDFVRQLYEKSVEFNGVVVQILDDPQVLADQGQAMERLFERYHRLTPRRLYTVTPGRVKIRQLPGVHT